VRDAPVKYRYPVGKRVGDSLAGVLAVLGGVFLIVESIVIGVDPESVGSAGPVVGRSVLVFCLGAGLAYAGFVYARRVISDRLIVASDGLVCRAGSWARTRATTIPWSSVTSFAVKTSQYQAYRHAVYAILNTGQQVRLPCTARSRRPAAAAIARELAAELREHHDGEPGNPGH
jgi:hypothetical protein